MTMENQLETCKPQMYLFTRKDKNGVHRTVYQNFTTGLNAFYRYSDKFRSKGYDGVVNAIHDQEQYIKVAKYTKGDDTIRLRLENVDVDETCD